MKRDEQMKRGDIYYALPPPPIGREQGGYRPAIIVSNNLNNLHSSTVEVVYLTTKPKHNLPTHVDIYSAPRNPLHYVSKLQQYQSKG